MSPGEGSLSLCGLPSTRVVLVVFPLASPSVLAYAGKLVTVLCSTTSGTILVTGGIPAQTSWPDGLEVVDSGIRLHYLKDQRPAFISLLVWIAKALAFEVMSTKAILELGRAVDVLICSQGFYSHLPMLVGRLMGLKVVCTSFGSSLVRARMSYRGPIVPLIGLLTWMRHFIADKVIVESERLVEEDPLTRRFRSKCVNGALFVDTQVFHVTRPLRRRRNVVGFVGRLAPEKGACELLSAIPLCLSSGDDIEFLIVGSGPLEDELRRGVESSAWESRVTWLPWIPHHQMPRLLNEMKLLVLPSYTEGLPSIVLEAFGCGTPVLAAGVGGVPDVVVDGTTGFLLRERTAEGIAKEVLRALDTPDLDAIALAARSVVERDYTLQAAVARYRSLLDRVACEQ